MENKIEITLKGGELLEFVGELKVLSCGLIEVRYQDQLEESVVGLTSLTKEITIGYPVSEVEMYKIIS